MDFQYLKEYIEFSKQLNFSATARMLHISQSSLSKHMADLEKDLGFVLATRRPKPALTPAGKIFLEYAENMFYGFDQMIEKCRKIQRGNEGKIVVQDPLIDVTIGHQSISVFMYFSENYPLIDIELYTIKGATVAEALNAGTVDIGYLMAYGDQETIIKDQANRGIMAFPLKHRRFAVWMSRNNLLASKENLSISDLENTSFLIPADRLFNDWRLVLEQVCLAHGFFPKINLKVTPTINGYFAINTRDGVVVLSEAFLSDPRFLMRDDMVVRKLSDEDCVYTLFCVYRKDNNNPILPLFVEELQKTVGMTEAFR